MLKQILTIIFTIYIDARMLNDLIGFPFPKLYGKVFGTGWTDVDDMIEWMNKRGWPINKWWLKSIFSSLVIMAIFPILEVTNSSLVTVYGKELNLYYLLPMVLTPASWAIMMFIRNGSKMMFTDAISFVFIPIFAIAIHLM